jgi:apolipoprotein D and lipocalin family protein
MKLILALLMTSVVYAGNRTNVATTTKIDINKYVGTWYAISALPQRFTKNCVAQTAEYAVLSETRISVKNTCLRDHKKSKLIFGYAYVTNKVTNSELIVRFNTWWARLFGVKGDYNIVKIDPNYEYVIIGGNDRKSLWIMSRRPSMDEQTYNEYVEYAKKLGFAVEKLKVSEF